MNNVRPTLPQAAQSSIDAEFKEGKAHGLMHDSFMEAVRIRFGGYATGLEEREALRRIELVMTGYFEAKRTSNEAVSFVTPERMRNMVETMTKAVAVMNGIPDEQSS